MESRKTQKTIKNVIFQLLSLIAESKGGDAIDLSYGIKDLHPFLKAFLIFFSREKQWVRDIKATKDSKCLIELEKTVKVDTAFDNTLDPNFSNVIFDRDYEDIDRMETLFLDNINLPWRIKSILSYLIGELICNIQEHSEALKGFLSVQTIDDDLYICIADDGITIPGSYFLNNKRKYLDIIGSDSLEALRYSIRGLSTKDRPVSESRGYGISTNLNLVVNGMKGFFILLSGDTLYLSSEGEETYMKIPDASAFDGTMFLISLPIKVREEFNLYDFVK